MAMNVFQLMGQVTIHGAAAVQQELNNMSSKLKDVGEKFNKFGDNMKKAGEGISKGLGVPLAAVGGFAIKAAADFDAASTTIQTELGVTGQEAARLNDVARDVWKQGFGEDLNSVAQNVANVQKQLGDLTDNELAGMTKGLAMFEKQGWGDTQETLRATKILMEQFGMSSTEAMDHLTAGFQQGLDYSGEFLDSISEYSTYYSEMGFSSEQMFSALKSGAESGAFQLDKVGDAMKEFTLRSKDGSEATNESFERLGLGWREMGAAFNEGGEKGQKAFQQVVEKLQGVENETMRNEIATNLFGTQYEDLGEEAFNAMIQAGEGLENVAGSTDRAGQVAEESFGNKFNSTIRTLQDSLVPLGMVILDLAQRYLPPLLEKVEGVTKWFQGLSETGQNVVVFIGAFLIALGPFLVILGSIVGAVGNLIPMFMNVFKVLNVVKLAFTFLTGPVGLIIAAIAALIAIGILVYKNWDVISAWFVQLWENIKIVALAAWNGLVNGIKAIGSAIANFFVNLWNGIKSVAITLWNGLVNGIMTIITTLKNWIVTKFTEIKNKITEAFTTAKNKVLEIWGTIKTNITNKINEIKSSVTTTFGKIKDAIFKPIQEARDKVIGFINEILKKMGFKWEIPKPKVPKISLKWSTKEFFGKEIKYPSGFDVKWNAAGGIVDGAQLIGAGERGKEMIMPLEGKYFKPVAEMIADNINALGGVAGLAGVLEIPVVVNGRELARAVVTDLDKEIARQRKIKERGL